MQAQKGQGVLSLLGMAVRARRAVKGSDNTLKAIQSGQATLVLLAHDAGPNITKKMRDKCSFYHIPLVATFCRVELGHACGRDESVVVAVTDPGFATKMLEYVGEHIGGEAFDQNSSV